MEGHSEKVWAHWALALGIAAALIHVLALSRYGGSASAATFAEALEKAFVALGITIVIHLVAGLVSVLGVGFAVIATRRGAKGVSFKVGWTLNVLSASFGLYVLGAILADKLFS